MSCICLSPVRFRCSKCLMKLYCSKNCYINDWKAHKQICVISEMEVIANLFSEIKYTDCCLSSSLILMECLKKRDMEVNLIFGYIVFSLCNTTREYVWVENELGEKFDIREMVVNKCHPDLKSDNVWLAYNIPKNMTLSPSFTEEGILNDSKLIKFRLKYKEDKNIVEKYWEDSPKFLTDIYKKAIGIIYEQNV